MERHAKESELRIMMLNMENEARNIIRVHARLMHREDARRGKQSDARN